MGKNAKAIIPDLTNALQDQDISVRSLAASALKAIDIEAEHFVSEEET